MSIIPESDPPRARDRETDRAFFDHLLDVIFNAPPDVPGDGASISIPHRPWIVNPPQASDPIDDLDDPDGLLN